VIIVRVILIKHELKNKKPTKTLELVKKTKLITFQEIILTAGVIGLFFTFVGLKQNQTSFLENVENFEVRNRPYIFVSNIKRELTKEKTGLNCELVIANTGPVAGFNVVVKFILSVGEEKKEGPENEFYSAVYPNQIIWFPFGFPINENVPITIHTEISYKDYRQKNYEYNVTWRYNYEYRTFTIMECYEEVK